MAPGGRRRKAQKITFLAVVFVAAIALAGSLTVAAVSNAQVQATATVATVPKPATTVGTEILTLSAERYAAEVGAPAALARIAETAGLPAELVGDTQVQVLPGSSSIQITARGGNNVWAAAAANAVAGEARWAAMRDELVTVDLVALAIVGEPPPASLPANLTIIAVGVSLIAAVSAWLLAQSLLRSTPNPNPGQL